MDPYDDDDRLPTDIWVRVKIRHCSTLGVPAVIARKGEPARGTIVLKLNGLEAGCRVLTQARDLEGRRGWLPAARGMAMPEPDADALIARAVTRDPDLWVVEIEHRDFWHPFEGKEFG